MLKEDAVRDCMTIECDHNLLFGTYEGSPVGICYSNDLASRNLNTLVLSSDYKRWANYIYPNLLAGHSSAVVVNDVSPEVLPYILKKGINVYIMRFTFGQNADDLTANHYNPFNVQHIPSDISREQAQCKRALYLAETVYKMFHINKPDETDEYFENIYYEFLKFIFLYTGMVSGDFTTVKTVIHDLMDNGKPALEKYDVSDIKRFTECRKHILENCDDKTFDAVLTVMMVELQPLVCCDTFTEDKKMPLMNISVEKLVNELTYLFVPPSLAGSANKLTVFTITMLLQELYDYGNNKWKHMTQALENTVHFYLNHANLYYIPDLVKYMTTCRAYGIGISVISDIQGLKRTYSHIKNEAQILCCNVDTVLLLSNRDGWGYADIEFIQERYMPALSAEGIHSLLEKDKCIVCIRDSTPVICDVLRPEDYKGEEIHLGMILDQTL